MQKEVDYAAESEKIARFSVMASPPYILQLPPERMAAGLTLSEARLLAADWNARYQKIDATRWCVLSFLIQRESIGFSRIVRGIHCAPGDFFAWKTEEPTKHPSVVTEVIRWGEVVEADDGAPVKCLDSTGQPCSFPAKGFLIASSQLSDRGAAKAALLAMRPVFHDIGRIADKLEPFRKVDTWIRPEKDFLDTFVRYGREVVERSFPADAESKALARELFFRVKERQALVSS